MAPAPIDATLDDIADTCSADHPRRFEMNHPETMLQLAKARHAALEDEARRDRLVRNRSSVVHEEPRDRFRVRDLRWLLFKPTGA
jgi:hypothetical protein